MPYFCVSDSYFTITATIKDGLHIPALRSTGLEGLTTATKAAGKSWPARDSGPPHTAFYKEAGGGLCRSIENNLSPAHTNTAKGNSRAATNNRRQTTRPLKGSHGHN